MHEWVLTCDRFGWWELNRVLVSTCSCTNPWSLRTCSASLSLAGPKCWCCCTVLPSAKNAVSVNITDINSKKASKVARQINPNRNTTIETAHWVCAMITGLSRIAIPNSCRWYSLPAKDNELPSPSMRGLGTPRTLARFWSIWEGFSWSLHWLIPDLQDVRTNVDV